MNSRMAALGVPDLDVAPSGELDPRLAAILEDGLADVGPCVVLAHHLDLVTEEQIDSYPDATRFEAFVNHVHLDEELALPGTDPRVLEQARLYAAELSELLAGRHPGEAFVMVLTVSESCVVRFHKLRSGEAWVDGNLETYEHEAVMVAQLPFSTGEREARP